MTSKRVVITGLGMVCPIGLSAEDAWKNILESKSGIRQITEFDTTGFPCKIAGRLTHPDENRIFKAEDYITTVEARRIDPFILQGIAAGMQAIEDSGWAPSSQQDKDRTGVMIGSGIGGLSTIENHSIIRAEGNKTKVTPFFIPASLINLISGHISIKYGFSGPNHAVVTACSTGANAIGDAARMIKYGDADVMIAGGAEASITPIGVTGFASARALCTSFNDNPKESSRPFDQDRAGFVMGEGAGVVVLEEYEHAVKRGAKIYAEILGYNISADAYHITAPHPEGRGARRAMQGALADAQISADKIDYINAHGTSTPVGDKIELMAVQEVFKNSLDRIKMSSTKSAIGHMLGAAGSVEMIFTTLAMRDSIAPPTINLHNPIEEASIDLVPNEPKKLDIKHAMSNSFGFGGTNTSLVIGKI